jgi:lipid-binding SYLF domain-containing protein
MSKTKSKPAQKQQNSLDEEARATRKRLEEKDPGLRKLLKKAHGYAVFPTVGKASLVVGGSYGHGVVYEQGELVGYATIGQTTVGVQLGGKTFTEVLIFEDEQALDRFKQSKVRFAANASTALVKAGAMATKDLEKGIKVLAYSKGGMMLEAAVGGQKFRFKPADESGQEPDDEDGDLGEADHAGSLSGGLAAKGMRVAAAAAAAALAQIKPEDVAFAIEALHKTLVKFAQSGADEEEQDEPARLQQESPSDEAEDAAEDDEAYDEGADDEFDEDESEEEDQLDDESELEEDESEEESRAQHEPEEEDVDEDEVENEFEEDEEEEDDRSERRQGAARGNGSRSRGKGSSGRQKQRR